MASHNKVTLKSIAKNIYPEWELEDWFMWAPNIFALISIVFHRTGAYKICLIEPKPFDVNGWQKNVEFDAELWIEYSNNLILGEEGTELFSDKTKLLKDNYEVIKKCWDLIDINTLRVISETKNDDSQFQKSKDFAVSMAIILIISDSSSCGFGLVCQPISVSQKKYKLLHAVANMLLNNTGSLSSISKFHGIVLPKMRTPQSGLVLRSLSHQLTFHVTEVEVMWRSFPWLNNHKQSLNVLAVPYPDDVKKTTFETLEDNYHFTRYFRGKINKTDEEKSKVKILIDNLVKEVIYQVDSKNEIDIIVLPEMALGIEDYSLLLEKLHNAYISKNDIIQLPIIISGVMREDDDDKSLPFHNEVRMAIFFAGKWYQTQQRKHHRWQIDRDQILQYKLEAYFATDKNWFEYCSISQRRLTILAPNGWLALTSLICEDLARQEPVGDVIRGIGPTLLMALLSDGPQLKNRWSARYASVLADDPGTAVLSLTSLGMVKRSQSTESLNNNSSKEAKLITIGLWKDMIRGWKELHMNEDRNALLFTISAKFVEEFTLDGRTDNTNASVFRMDTINPRQIKLGSKYVNNSESTDLVEKSYSEGSWDDIRDLSAILFSIDAIIDLLSQYHSTGDKKSIKQSVNIILNILNDEAKDDKQYPFLSEIKQNISNSWLSPDKVGIEAKMLPFNSSNSSNDIAESVQALKNLVQNIIEDTTIKNLNSFYDSVVRCCENSLVKLIDSPKERITKITITAFLFNIKTKLSNLKYRNPINEVDEINADSALEIREKIMKVLSAYLKEIKKNAEI